MRRFAVLLFAVVSFLLPRVASAGHDPYGIGHGPGPNGHNNHGLCTAYFAGSDKGRSNKRKAPPFQALEQVADDGDDETPVEDDVRSWCEANDPKFRG